MAMVWFTKENCTMGPTLSDADLSVINRAARHLIKTYNLSPTARNLGAIRQIYHTGMSAREVIDQVNDARDAALGAFGGLHT